MPTRLYCIATEYNAPLEAAHCYSDDDRYDLAQSGQPGQPTNHKYTGPLITATDGQKNLSMGVCGERVKYCLDTSYTYRKITITITSINCHSA